MQDGDQFDAHCEYSVFQEMLDLGRGEQIEGLLSWHGRFTTNSPRVATGAGSIELPDGRTGAIVVNEVWIPQGSGAFSGNSGPPT